MKRILAMLLALVMIISLLPLTAFAADPMPKFRMYDGNINPSGSAHVIESYFNDSKTVYVVFENVLDTDGVTVLGQKPVIASTVPTDNYVKYSFSTATATATITMKNVNFNRSPAGGDYFIYIVKNSGSSYTNEFNVVLNIEGTNVINSPNAKGYLHFENAGNLTVTGGGSLDLTSYCSSSGLINHVKPGNLLIKDVTLNLTNTYTGSVIASIVNDGNITIENANVRAENAKHRGIVASHKYNEAPNSSDYSITIKGSDVYLHGGAAAQLTAPGAITIENSNVEILKDGSNHTPVMSSMPTLVGTHSSVQAWISVGSNPTWKDWDGDIAAGTTLTTEDKFRGFKTVHTCAPQADDGDCTTAVTCVCGKEAVPAKRHIAGDNADDCTKDTMCGNTGCTKVFEAKKGDAHVAGQDDGDCTTDILCANTGCTQVAVEGAAKHVWDRANCDVAGSCTNPNCTKSIEAGTHSGGTATCKDKAKCDECGKEYGELGACKPAADDGDCTTAIKCSVCGKETTKGEAAHKYTDKNDTTCDNAGCTNTRKVEGTENPKTGDNSAIAVVAALMVTAAAAFVTTKKFAR